MIFEHIITIINIKSQITNIDRNSRLRNVIQLCRYTLLFYGQTICLVFSQSDFFLKLKSMHTTVYLINHTTLPTSLNTYDGDNQTFAQPNRQRRFDCKNKIYHN